jgi:hypothetical protein
MDATAGGTFLSLTLPVVTALVEKIASNQSWNEDLFNLVSEVEVCIKSKK